MIIIDIQTFLNLISSKGEMKAEFLGRAVHGSNYMRNKYTTNDSVSFSWHEFITVLIITVQISYLQKRT